LISNDVESSFSFRENSIDGMRRYECMSSWYSREKTLIFLVSLNYSPVPLMSKLKPKAQPVYLDKKKRNFIQKVWQIAQIE
jgi:hypothetical protein